MQVLAARSESTPEDLVQKNGKASAGMGGRGKHRHVSDLSAERAVHLLPGLFWAMLQAYSQPAFSFDGPLEASPFLNYILVSELGYS